MNPRNRHKIATILVFIVLFSTVTLAFGYMKGQETATVRAGETTTFQFYVFGDNGSIEVQNTEHPTGWQVDVTPSNIELPPKENYRYRQTSDGYQKIAPVTVEIYVPANAQPGSQTVTVNIQQRGEESIGYLNVQQVQDFDFTVQVEGDDAPTDTSAEEKTAEEKEEQVDDTTGTTVDANQSGEEETQSPGGQNATAQESGGESEGLPWTTVGIIVFEILWVVAVIYLVKERYF